MSKKIAIPTNGELLDAYFGKAAGFTVFEIIMSSIEFIKKGRQYHERVV